MSTIQQPTDSTQADNPNSVASAAELLAKFCARDGLLVSRGAGPQLTDDDRTAVIAAQLLAIATQLERVADGLDALVATDTGPGKTHSVAWFLSRLTDAAERQANDVDSIAVNVCSAAQALEGKVAL